MNREWPSSYRRIEPVSPDTETLEVWNSTVVADPLWDNFLRRTPCGQYQQSSLWAEFKAGEGWQFHRVVVTEASGIVGGFQILWRKKGPVRIGYVSKGPVAAPETHARVLALARLLTRSAKELGLSALIVQAPDERQVDLGAETPPGFVESNPQRVIDATYLIDVSPGMEALRRVMHRNVRQCVRKAREQGLTVRAGTEADLPLFFELMSATCRRQRSSPNPSSVEGLTRLWRLFAQTNDVEMSFAEGGGEVVAGRMNLIFGDRVTQWKKGWNGTHPEWHPNEFLADHALEWAQTRGYRLCDFSAMNRSIAERILEGKEKDPVGPHSRDRFNLRLGGYPKLLPRAQLFLPNPLVRWVYRNTYVRREQNQERLLQGGTVSSSPK